MRSAITQYKECSSEVATEMKTPPDRSGIKFEVGAQLEARDQHKKWYPATIERIDYEKEQVLIHYRQWSRRHNEWFQWNSPYLRPLERVSLRRQGLSPLQSTPMFVAGTKVLACWTDCRFYPAKILRVNKDDSYTVRFYDGVVRTVKPTKVKPFQRKPRAERSAVGSEGWEEGESEEDGEVKGEGLGEEEEQTKGDEGAQEKGASEGMDETEGGKQERDTPPSSSDPPAKKKLDDDRGSDVNAQSLPADSTLSDPSSPTHINPDVLLERQAHLPTTHKFSREPLYRVIKNQPPPILSIELDHNPFKCPSAGCSKSFRKASLLHYHIKYYHSDQQLDGGGAPEAARRKRSSSEAGDFVFSRRMENQSSSCYQDDTEQSILGNEMKKNGGKEKTGEQERKERKHFLKVKLRKKKKKKKRKSQPDFSQSSFSSGYGSSDDENTDRPPITLKLSHTLVDEGSDWSTLTAESGEDTPCWPVSMETDECEVVRCVCEVDEENDFMIQCESCLCWQHGTCMGLYEDNVPHNYICYYCRQTAGWRHAQRFLSETDWLISGHMFGLSCVKQNYAQINGSKISHTRQLLAHTYQISQVLSGLQLKISLLHSPSQSDLQLWRLPWRQEEVGRLMSSPKGEPPVCYVSSEHCYQKPGASWEKADEQDGERQITSVKEEAETDEKETKPEDVAQQTFDTTAHLYVPNNLNIKQEGIPYVEISHPTHSASVSECQLNLLDHVESLHQQISTRMDLIERELDVLESWLDHSGELEPPDPLSRLPQLKLRIKQLLSDLCLVRRLSVCH